MSLFFILLSKIIPLYFNIFLGYISTVTLKIDKNSLATLLFYIISPLVVFHATLNVSINPAILFLPIFFYLLSSAIAFLFYYLFNKQWDDATGNILAFTAGTGNTGYFGIPLALTLLDAELANIFIFIFLSSLFYEATTGFFITAKGKFSAGECIYKIAKLPSIYTFFLALFLNISGTAPPEMLVQFSGSFKEAFAILGMMVIGMGLQEMRQGDTIDLKFISLAFFAKLLLWPSLILAVIYLDSTLTHYLSEDLYKVMFLFSLVPMAGNTVTLAVLFDAKPAKASFTVILCTAISILYIPTMLYVYGGF